MSGMTDKQIEEIRMRCARIILSSLGEAMASNADFKALFTDDLPTLLAAIGQLTEERDSREDIPALNENTMENQKIEIFRSDWDYMRGYVECLGYLGTDNMLFTDAVTRLQDMMARIDDSLNWDPAVASDEEPAKTQPCILNPCTGADLNYCHMCKDNLEVQDSLTTYFHPKGKGNG